MREAFQTERLRLRDIREADAPLLVELDSDPEVMRYIGPYGAWDVAQYRERIRSAYLPLQSHPWHGLHLIEEREDRSFLGWVFARPATAAHYADSLGWRRDDEIEIGYRLHRHAWGRGVATEAARPLVERALADPTVRAVVSCAANANLGSLRVLEKLGLVQIGEARIPDLDLPLIRFRREREAT